MPTGREGRTCDMLFFCNVNLQFRIKRENPSFHLTNVKSLGRWKILIKLSNKTKYRKVASSRPVYYSIFDLFWGATNQDVLLTEMCYYFYIQKSIKWWVYRGPCVFSSINVNSQWLALFLQISFKNVLKTLDGTFLLLWKCIFISKNWKNLIRIFEDPTFWIYFSNQNVGSSRILIRFFQFLFG